MLHLDCTVLSFDVYPSKIADHSPDWSHVSSHSIEDFEESALMTLAHFNLCVTECLPVDYSALPYLDK